MPISPEDSGSYIIPSNVPAFLVKLWKLVEDPQYEMHISWNRSGTGFIVHDQATFAREILPKYFKHNNFASFVRQLNMYGFRKVIGAEQGGLRSERDEWEFHNTNFQRAEPQLLEHVKRKAAPEDKKMKSEDVVKVFNDVQEMKGKQDDMTAKLDMMKRENEALWRELVDLRQKHQKQQQVVNKLIYFFMRLMNQNDKLANRKRLMLEDSVTAAEQHAKRSRQEYGEPSMMPTVSQPPPYTVHPQSSTQTVTISDISNSPNGMSSNMQSTSSGPLITTLPDDDDVIRPTMSSSRPVVILPDSSSISTKPIVTSPHSSTPGKSYPHATVIQPTTSTTTGVVTFPDEPHHISVSQQPQVMEPMHYQDASQLMGVQRVARPVRHYGEEQAYDRNSQLDEAKYLMAQRGYLQDETKQYMKQRNQMNDQIDFIGANLDSIQHVLANQQNLFDPMTLSDLFTPESSNPTPPQDLLDSLADRAASPMPPMSVPSTAQQLVQYSPSSMQGSANSRQAMASSRARQQAAVGRKAMEWPMMPGQQYEEEEDNGQRLRSGYDVQDLFNG